MFRVTPAGIVHLGSNRTITAAELLRRGDAVMRARWPVLAPTFYVDGYLMRCRFVYPGELSARPLRIDRAAVGQGRHR